MKPSPFLFLQRSIMAAVVGLAMASPSASAEDRPGRVLSAASPVFPDVIVQSGEPKAFRCGKVDAVFETESAEARRWVNSGLAALYAESESEALRCFHRATVADPGCARAWWGVTMSIDGRLHEWAALRTAAAARAAACAVSPREKGWAAMAGSAAKGDLAGALEAVRGLQRNDPDDADAAVWLATLSVDPVKSGGEASEFQRFAEESLTEWLERAPNHPGVLNGSVRVLFAHPTAENVRLAAGRSRALEPLAADWGPTRRLIGEAAALGGAWSDAWKACEAGDRWNRTLLKENGWKLAEFPEGLRTLQWRGLAAGMAGKANDARDAAASLEGAVPDRGREASEGGQIWLYHGRTAQGALQWRLGRLDRAVEAMKPVLAAPEMSYAGVFALHLEVLRAIEAGRPADADRQMNQFEAAMDAYLSPIAGVKQIRNRRWQESAKVAGILEGYAAARLHALAKDRPKAVSVLEEADRRARDFGPSLRFWLPLDPEEMAAAVWSELGDFSAAAEALRPVKASGYARLALAGALVASGRPAEATAPAREALKIWEQADADFEPAKRARSLAGLAADSAK